VHQSIWNRVLGKKTLADNIVVEEHQPVVEVLNNIDDNNANKSNNNRVGKCGRKRKDDAALPSSKCKQPAHGADSFLRYQDLVKAESTATSILVRDENFSYLRAIKSMQATLNDNGVILHESTCREHVKKALDNGCVGIDPQLSGGQALPSAIEKNIAKMVKLLREQHYPVFPDDVLKWATYGD
jgi:hypothetical protein